MNNPKIKFILNSVVTDIIGKDTVQGVRIKNATDGEVTEIPTDGVFIFIGHSPNSQVFESQVELDAQGYIVVDKAMHTNVPGVYAAGEVADPTFRQVITSAGMGAAAAMQAIHYLESMEQIEEESSVPVRG